MFLSIRWNRRLTWHSARRAVNSKQHCCIVSCSKQLCCWTITLLLYRVHDMRTLFLRTLQHSILIRMMNMAKMMHIIPGNARKKEEYFGSTRWCAQQQRSQEPMPWWISTAGPQEITSPRWRELKSPYSSTKIVILTTMWTPTWISNLFQPDTNQPYYEKCHR